MRARDFACVLKNSLRFPRAAAVKKIANGLNMENARQRVLAGMGVDTDRRAPADRRVPVSDCGLERRAVRLDGTDDFDWGSDFCE